ncbi:MAG: hypothetical protein JWP65_2692 [Ramlibacter sp.]|nr:hypothetical protein [Ramlibacter sp.]
MNRQTIIAMVAASAASIGNAPAGTSLAGDISIESTPARRPRLPGTSAPARCRSRTGRCRRWARAAGCAAA